MDSVMTVTGPIAADRLGFTLIHEHIFLDLMRDVWSGDGFLNDPKLAAEEIGDFREAGGVTIVDQTSGGLRGNDHDLFPIKHAEAVRQVAESTGVNIVLGCGWYRETYYEPSLWRKKTDEIAEELVVDLTEGIEGTDVRAGIIGEVGAHFNWLSPVEERVLRAAARAQMKTGVLLTTHSTRGPVGLDQLDILQQEGVDPRRVSIGHCHSYSYFEYHQEIARRGAFICFDRMGTLKGANDYEREKLLRAGWTGTRRRPDRPPALLARRLLPQGLQGIRRPWVRLHPHAASWHTGRAGRGRGAVPPHHGGKPPPRPDRGVG